MQTHSYIVRHIASEDTRDAYPSLRHQKTPMQTHSQTHTPSLFTIQPCSKIARSMWQGDVTICSSFFFCLSPRFCAIAGRKRERGLVEGRGTKKGRETEKFGKGFFGTCDRYFKKVKLQRNSRSVRIDRKVKVSQRTTNKTSPRKKKPYRE